VGRCVVVGSEKNRFVWPHWGCRLLVCLNTVVDAGRSSMHGWLRWYVRRSRPVSLIRLRWYARGCRLVGLGWLRRGSLTSGWSIGLSALAVLTGSAWQDSSESASRAGSAGSLAAAVAGGLWVFYPKCLGCWLVEGELKTNDDPHCIACMTAMCLYTRFRRLPITSWVRCCEWIF